jgi:triacylglycerol esterase/lipase EstA (alpha/beta hydrolase family)
LKKVFSLLFVWFLVMTAVATPADAGKFTNPGSGGTPGTWYIGSTPDNLNPSAPVILFVQGLNSSASTWYDNNDMYETAYNNGYQTAFLELYDSSGTSEDMWDNGSLLAAKIQEIYNYFGKKLVLVTHSKGGIDAQTALVHYNAYPYVSNVITLGSPHYGSQLADLAYSSWASWLTDILGSKSDGTYSLQTSYMNYFRSITDHHANVNKNNYYTLAGTKWGSFGSSLYWGGLYLSQYGTNDGAVTVANAYLPNGQMLRIGDWNHSTIKYGSSTFSIFKPFLTTNGAASSSIQTASLVSEKGFESDEAGSHVIRGGIFQQTAVENLIVESNVRTLTINWMSDQPVDTLTMISPDHQTVNVPVDVYQEEGVFQGAWNHVAVINQPMSGEWKIEAKNDDTSAYLFVATFDSELTKNIKLKPKNNKDKWVIEMDGTKIKTKKTKVEYSLDFVAKENNPGKKKGKKLKEKVSLSEHEEIMIPKQNEAGVYHLTIDIKGETLDGKPFERTFVQTIYKDEKGNMY